MEDSASDCLSGLLILFEHGKHPEKSKMLQIILPFQYIHFKVTTCFIVDMILKPICINYKKLGQNTLLITALGFLHCEHYLQTEASSWDGSLS